jgi:hypothetical protein
VEVFEHEHERPVLRERLEQRAPGRELLRTPLGAGRGVLARGSYEAGEVAHDPLGVGGQRSQLGSDGVGRVALEDPRERLDDLPERPEARLGAVRQRATPQDSRGVVR